LFYDKIHFTRGGEAMDESFGSRLKHAWNAFMNRSPTYRTADHGASYSYRPDRPRLTRGNERSIITSVYNRIAMDVAAISIQHVRLDANGRFLSAMDSGLNRCLTLEANLDQTGRGFDGSTGDGILMAEKLGAQTVDMDAIQLIPLRGGRLLNYVGGDIYVDSEGKRFIDESKGVKAIAKAYLNLPDRVFWVITDSQSQKSLDLDAKLLAGSVHIADSVSEMAKKMHVSAKVLQETLDRYNRFVEQGEDKDFGKKIFTQKIEKPPFYFGGEQFDIHYSCGGLKINKTCQVIGKADKPIPNLYAVGEVTGGIHGRDRLGGDSLISCFVFGKIAGEEIAKKQKSCQ